MVRVVGACGDCHSPVHANGNRNGPALSGGPALLSPVFEAHAPDITPGVKTGIGKDGAPLSPIMPWPYIQTMKPEDTMALVAWLRTLKPIGNAVAQ